MANNPVLSKLEKPAGRAVDSSGTSPQDLHRMYNQPTYPGQFPAPNVGQNLNSVGSSSMPPQPPTPGYGRTRPFDPAPGSASRYMTLDDVVVRTGAMLVTLMITGAFSWALATSQVATGLTLIGLIGGLGLGLYMALTTKANAVTALVYAGFEGLFLGAISRAFDNRYPGIVVQALTGTVLVAAGMLVVYKVGAIRVTPRLWRVVAGATIGVAGLMILNLVVSLFHSGGLGLREGGALGIAFSLLCIVIASFNLVLDFDLIERSIRQGTDEKFAWYCSFGLMVTLVWLYLEILRLLGNLRN